jgi:glyoxylase-like metal-dependent hydrolase (beta-lactamase superfamily II)
MEYAIVTVTPFMQNCTLLWCPDTRRGAVVDPGGEVERILAAAAKHGVNIEKVLLTHGHVDHVGGTTELVARLGVTVEGPQEEDAFWLDALPQQCAMFGFPDTAAFRPDRWLKGGEVVTFGKVTLDVLHTPGHTPGHVVFFHRPSRLAIVGDVLFAGSIGRTDFPRGDHQTLIRSIRERLWPLGDDVTFVPGHGPESTFGEERRNNPFVAEGMV